MKCWKKNARRGSSIKLLAILFSVFFAAAVSFAQDSPSPQPPSQEQLTFRSQTNLVLVPALVRDASGHAVYGLEAKDFVLEDNGVAQSVQLDDESESEPLAIVVAVQTGRSARREFPRIRGLNSMLGPILDQPQTEIGIVEFDSQVRLVQDFTGDAGRIQRTLEGIDSGDGGAAIFDVVKYSCGLLNDIVERRRRVLLLVSETRDHGSRMAKIDDVVSLIGNSNISMYSLAFSPGLGDVIDPYRSKSSQDPGGPDLIAPLLLARSAMERNAPRAIAAQTGGEYETFATRDAFENHMLDFTNHLHSRYLLSFQPKNPQAGLHEIHVRLAEPKNGTVLARRSYWASPPVQ
jgi:VWFA-related protein